MEILNSSKSKQIHVGCNPVVCGSIRDTGISAENIVLLEDKLSLGPVLPITSTKFGMAREEFWREYFGQRHSPRSNIFEAFSNSLSKFRNATCITFWVGISLDEQLFLACAVAMCRHFNIDFRKLHLILIQTDPISSHPLCSLGSLSADKYFEARKIERRLNSNEVDLILKAWAVVTSSNPASLALYLATPPGSLPIFTDRIQGLKWKYPSVRSGLGRTDHILLALCKSYGPESLNIFVEYHKRHMLDPECLDTYDVTKRLLALASSVLSKPLLLTNGMEQKFHRIEFTLSEFGDAVLEEKENFVDLNRIDQWIGGVHLQTSKKIWMFDASKNELAETMPRL